MRRSGNDLVPNGRKARARRHESLNMTSVQTAASVQNCRDHRPPLYVQAEHWRAQVAVTHPSETVGVQFPLCTLMHDTKNSPSADVGITLG